MGRRKISHREPSGAEL